MAEHQGDTRHAEHGEVDSDDSAHQARSQTIGDGERVHATR